MDQCGRRGQDTRVLLVDTWNHIQQLIDLQTNGMMKKLGRILNGIAMRQGVEGANTFHLAVDRNRVLQRARREGYQRGTPFFEAVGNIWRSDYRKRLGAENAAKPDDIWTYKFETKMHGITVEKVKYEPEKQYPRSQESWCRKDKAGKLSTAKDTRSGARAAMAVPPAGPRAAAIPRPRFHSNSCARQSRRQAQRRARRRRGTARVRIRRRRA